MNPEQPSEIPLNPEEETEKEKRAYLEQIKLERELLLERQKKLKADDPEQKEIADLLKEIDEQIALGEEYFAE